jgi:hypothetical protein
VAFATAKLGECAAASERPSLVVGRHEKERDMETRATDWLLEALAERGDDASREIVGELRKRGNMLVNYEDVVAVASAARSAGVESDALERLEAKVGLQRQRRP